MKCDKCKGVGAHSYNHDLTKEERENGSALPSLLPRPTNGAIKLCDKCNGTGEINDETL